MLTLYDKSYTYIIDRESLFIKKFPILKPVELYNLILILFKESKLNLNFKLIFSLFNILISPL